MGNLDANLAKWQRAGEEEKEGIRPRMHYTKEAEVNATPEELWAMVRGRAGRRGAPSPARRRPCPYAVSPSPSLTRQRRTAEQEASQSLQSPVGGTPYSDVHSVACEEDLGLEGGPGLGSRVGSHHGPRPAAGAPAGAPGEPDVEGPHPPHRLDVVEEAENEDAPSSSYSLVSPGRRGGSCFSASPSQGAQ